MMTRPELKRYYQQVKRDRAAADKERMTKPELKRYYCAHCDPGSDYLELEHFIFAIGPARRLALCEQCYGVFAHHVIVDLVREAGKEIAIETSKRQFRRGRRTLGEDK